MAGVAIKSFTLYKLSIELRWRVSHAASQRSSVEPIVVSVELNDGTIGYGETLPRPYVTGESTESVVRAIENVFVPRLVEMHPERFPIALEAAEALPWRDQGGQPCPAARAAVELAILDAYARCFRRPLSEACGWMNLNSFGPPGSDSSTRNSGVLTSHTPGGTLKQLRLMWWYGLRDFKLKVGDDGETERVDVVADYLRKPMSRGAATLRVDANGGWTLDQAISRLSTWRDLGLSVVEQPLQRGAEDDLPELKSCVHPPLMYDESLVTMDDAKRLVEMQVADAFNIRISKCGGLLPSLRLAHYAQRQGVAVQLGCMVGETSILSAAGRRFLEMTPGVRFVEGCFGKLLLREDISHPSLRFGYGGRVGTRPGFGWGINVDAERLTELSTDKFIFPF